jgi:hypothetical protein
MEAAAHTAVCLDNVRRFAASTPPPQPISGICWHGVRLYERAFKPPICSCRARRSRRLLRCPVPAWRPYRAGDRRSRRTGHPRRSHHGASTHGRANAGRSRPGARRAPVRRTPSPGCRVGSRPAQSAQSTTAAAVRRLRLTRRSETLPPATARSSGRSSWASTPTGPSRESSATCPSKPRRLSAGCPRRRLVLPAPVTAFAPHHLRSGHAAAQVPGIGTSTQMVLPSPSESGFTRFLRGCPGLQAGEESDSCGAGQG